MKNYNLLFASLLFLFPNDTIAQERAIIKIDTDRIIDQINPHLYGNFRNIWDKVYMEVFMIRSLFKQMKMAFAKMSSNRQKS